MVYRQCWPMCCAVPALYTMAWGDGAAPRGLKCKNAWKRLRACASLQLRRLVWISSMGGAGIGRENLTMNRSTVAHQSAAITDLRRMNHQDASAHSRAGCYARMAERHWRRYRPAWVAVLEREGRLAQELLRAEQRMLHALEQQLRIRRAHDNVERLSYLDRVRWENSVRSAMEEHLLPEMILLPPEV